MTYKIVLVFGPDDGLTSVIDHQHARLYLPYARNWQAVYRLRETTWGPGVEPVSRYEFVGWEPVVQKVVRIAE